MKSIRIAALLTSVGLTAMTTGCATVTGGTTQNVSVKTQKSAADIAGANCVLTNSGGSYTVVTPGKVAVHREKDDLTVQCTKDGETSQVAKVESSYRKGAIVGDIAWLGVLSVVSYGIDRASGSVFAYPDDITVAFGDSAAPLPSADAVVPSAASTPKVTTESTVSTVTSPAQTN